MGIVDFEKEYEEYKGWCHNCVHRKTKVCDSCEQKTPSNFEEK